MRYEETGLTLPLHRLHTQKRNLLSPTPPIHLYLHPRHHQIRNILIKLYYLLHLRSVGRCVFDGGERGRSGGMGGRAGEGRGGFALGGEEGGFGEFDFGLEVGLEVGDCQGMRCQIGSFAYSVGNESGGMTLTLLFLLFNLPLHLLILSLPLLHHLLQLLLPRTRGHLILLLLLPFLLNAIHLHRYRSRCSFGRGS